MKIFSASKLYAAFILLALVQVSNAQIASTIYDSMKVYDIEIGILGSDIGTRPLDMTAQYIVLDFSDDCNGLACSQELVSCKTVPAIIPNDHPFFSELYSAFLSGQISDARFKVDFDEIQSNGSLAFCYIKSAELLD